MLETLIFKYQEEFPILGGRLLKSGGGMNSGSLFGVSNPWREAIEGLLSKEELLKKCSFQSLEGGY